MVATASKRRHEIEGDRVRALYGHSVPGRIQRRRGAPPSVLFHGTASGSWAMIAEEGLRPMGRHFVHLSVDRGAAVAVGRRKDVSPMSLLVDAAAAETAGVAFYEGNEFVWLAESVPAQFLAIAET